MYFGRTPGHGFYECVGKRCKRDEDRIPKDYFGEGLDEEVKKPILEAAEVLKNAGAEIEEFDLGLVKICDSGLLCHRISRGKFQPVPI